jgi:hypothetical protein
MMNPPIRHSFNPMRSFLPFADCCGPRPLL